MEFMRELRAERVELQAKQHDARRRIQYEEEQHRDALTVKYAQSKDTVTKNAKRVIYLAARTEQIEFMRSRRALTDRMQLLREEEEERTFLEYFEGREYRALLASSRGDRDRIHRLLRVHMARHQLQTPQPLDLTPLDAPLLSTTSSRRLAATLMDSLSRCGAEGESDVFRAKHAALLARTTPPQRVHGLLCTTYPPRRKRSKKRRPHRPAMITAWSGGVPSNPREVFEDEEQSAGVVQRAWRSHRAKKELEIRREEARTERALARQHRERAARRIQKVWRDRRESRRQVELPEPPPPRNPALHSCCSPTVFVEMLRLNRLGRKGRQREVVWPALDALIEASEGKCLDVLTTAHHLEARQRFEDDEMMHRAVLQDKATVELRQLCLLFGREARKGMLPVHDRLLRSALADKEEEEWKDLVRWFHEQKPIRSRTPLPPVPPGWALNQLLDTALGPFGGIEELQILLPHIHHRFEVRGIEALARASAELEFYPSLAHLRNLVALEKEFMRQPNLRSNFTKLGWRKRNAAATKIQIFWRERQQRLLGVDVPHGSPGGSRTVQASRLQPASTGVISRRRQAPAELQRRTKEKLEAWKQKERETAMRMLKEETRRKHRRAVPPPPAQDLPPEMHPLDLYPPGTRVVITAGELLGRQGLIAAPGLTPDMYYIRSGEELIQAHRVHIRPYLFPLKRTVELEPLHHGLARLIQAASAKATPHPALLFISTVADPAKGIPQDISLPALPEVGKGQGPSPPSPPSSVGSACNLSAMPGLQALFGCQTAALSHVSSVVTSGKADHAVQEYCMGLRYLHRLLDGRVGAVASYIALASDREVIRLHWNRLREWVEEGREGSWRMHRAVRLEEIRLLSERMLLVRAFHALQQNVACATRRALQHLQASLLGHMASVRVGRGYFVRLLLYTAWRQQRRHAEETANRLSRVVAREVYAKYFARWQRFAELCQLRYDSFDAVQEMGYEKLQLLHWVVGHRPLTLPLLSPEVLRSAIDEIHSPLPAMTPPALPAPPSWTAKEGEGVVAVPRTQSKRTRLPRFDIRSVLQQEASAKQRIAQMKQSMQRQRAARLDAQTQELRELQRKKERALDDMVKLRGDLEADMARRAEATDANARQRKRQRQEVEMRRRKAREVAKQREVMLEKKRFQRSLAEEQLRKHLVAPSY